MSGPGIWRALAMTKYLPEFGISPVVLCSDRSPSRARFDRTLLSEIPDGAQVHRISSYFQGDLLPPLNMLVEAVPNRRRLRSTKRFLMRARSRFVYEYPDQQAHWALKVATKGIQLARARKIDCIITSGPPHVSHVAGLAIHKASGLPWLMDYRDLWTDDKVQIKQSSYQQSMFEKLERRAIAASTAVVAVSPYYIDHLSQRFSAEKPKSKYHLIRNGHDLPDAILEEAQAAPSNDRLHLHFNGTPQVTHPFSTVLDALERLRTRGEALPLVTFTGMTEKFQQEVQDRGFEADVRNVGLMPKLDSVRYSMGCDVLIAMVNNANPLYRGTIPGKAYEAIALGRHLWGILPPDTVVRQMVEDPQTGTICNVDDLDDVERGLLRIIDLHRSGELHGQDLQARKDRAQKYSRRHQAQQLANLVRQVCAEGA